MHAWQRRIPLILFVLSTGIYLLTLQRAIYGDGIFLEPQLTAGELAYNHILYLPLVWTVWSGIGAVVDISAETSMKVVSALAGGAGVALTYLIALRVLSSALHALAAALLLMGLFGYWFHSTATEVHAVHSTCALVLCLGLSRTLDAGNAGHRLGLLTICLLFLGTVLTPASHTSGIAMLLPIAYVAWRARPVRGQLLIATGAGLVVFAAGYQWLISSNPYLQTYVDNHTAKMFSILTSPGALFPKTLGGLRECLFYALPASTVMPAGLRVLFRIAPGHGWLFLLWLVSWFLMVLPVGDFAYGSYFVPTFGVQAILAMVAFNALSTSIRRALLLTTLPLLPALLAVDSMDVALLLWGAVAAWMFMMARRDVTPSPRWFLALPVTSIALSATFLLPMLRQDPIRDRIHAVQETVGPTDLVFYLAPHGITYSHWRRFFPGADGPDRRALNLSLLDYPSLRPALPDELGSRVQQAHAGTRRLWLVGHPWSPPGGHRFREFRDLLEKKFSFDVPEGAPDDVYLLTPKH
ncbi:MAG: hypothetical protein V3U11_06995 [Planctomycetota bacterium]